MASGYRRMRGEDDLRGDATHGLGREDALADHPLPHELHAGEGAVSLVEVHDSRRDAQRSESPDTTDAEQQFLADPDALVAAVQACGQLAVFRLVAVDVGIEQQQRDPPDRHLQDSGGDRSRARLDRDRDRLAAGARRGLNREHTRVERLFGEARPLFDVVSARDRVYRRLPSDAAASASAGGGPGREEARACA